ncbi:MAG: signal transduction histidine kinase [Candidatus Ozemobacter sibiricus]|uniref:histidine kinase n=1 Tax=Candidatus Ozemobacter sibiricus TaxID=2268124 RepID=A0A367ZRF1_9BACT|nr:MAG: signal transduction histidine kinase [Candidatus Ozemobacter sibiricus]
MPGTPSGSGPSASTCPHGFRICREAMLHLANGRFDVEVRAEPSCEVCTRLETIRQVGEALRNRAEATADLLRLTARLTANTTLEEVLNNVYEGFRRHIPYDRIGVALLSDDGQEVRSIWARSEAPQIRLGPGYKARLAGSSLQAILETGHLRILNDLPGYLAAHPGSHSTRLIVEEGMQSSLTCPLRAGGRPIGFLFFSSLQPATYRSIHQEVFTQVTDNLSIIVERTLAYQRLVELNNLKNKFLGIAAHDLRNPLALLVSFIELLTDPAVGGDPAQRARLLDRMQATTTRMLTLVNDLLDLSAIESGQIRIEPEPIDVRRLLEETFEHHRLLAARKEIGLVLEAPPTLPSLVADPRRLSQVLDNLLSNAVKFSPRGTTVTLGAQPEHDFLHIWVTDQGRGIPTADLPKLFTEFGRTSVKPTEGEKSTGLGLAIVKKIVERHGGKVAVTSQEGKGSTFSVRLPLAGPSTP